MPNLSEEVSLIWSVADLRRGDFKQSEYGQVNQPFTVQRRLDQVLPRTRENGTSSASGTSATTDSSTSPSSAPARRASCWY